MSSTLEVCVHGRRQQPTTPPAAEIARKRRNEYVEQHLHLVDAIARRLIASHHWPPNVDIEDLRGAGYVGLIQAAERYTRALNTQFGTYAAYRIRGEMLELVRRRELRESSGEPLPVEISQRETTHPARVLETAIRVRSILERLTPREQAAIRARFFEGHTLAGVARRLNVSPTRAGRIIRDTLARVRAEAA